MLTKLSHIISSNLIITFSEYGKFFFAHLFVCSLAAAADSIEIMSLSMILPSATCDLQLTSVFKGWINASVFIGKTENLLFFSVGMTLGGIVWGPLADVSGRKSIMLTSLTLNWVAALISSFVNNPYVFTILRFFSGLGIGGSIPVIFTFFIEFQHKSLRGTMGCSLTIAWMFGNVFQAGLAWAIIPNKVGISTSILDYTGWRMFIAVCVIPSFVSVLILIAMPESPKYLLQEERNEEAIAVVRKVYRWNNNEEIEIKKIILAGDENTSLVKQNKEEGKFKNCSIFNQVSELFSKKYRCLSFITIGVIGFFSYGYYGLFMWFPELFRRMGDMNGSSFCGLSSNQNTTPVVSTEIESCNELDNQVYIDSLISMSASVVGPLLIVFYVDRIGRKPFLVGGLLCGAFSLFFFYFITTRVHAIILSSVFALFASIVFSIFDIVAVEQYPTHVRSTAFGIFCAAIRLAAILANVSFGMLIDQNCSAMIITPALLLLASGILAFWTPDMTQKDIY
ncbi:hypothetical protein LOTGIDRAFT_122544 [Lottia gigantea]|uniref:Major facilitator superfamily (MFS) profile domain-containing protein n=1 Tax=Lottia gigantea TaxID=225164 RepID=V4ACK1_LOTGI|nr:hypothetical protein LOTGIDRAFT_122544 [Lottia gigantea]ESO91041.1 hypothetical protein LOTGIDRAFT_122544 [Lottia gigantea]